MSRVVVSLVMLLGCGDDSAVLGPDAGASADGASEPCDDHNRCTTDRQEGAACVHDPIPSCCGNGTVEPGEACDDGNQADFDGCSSACLHERAVVMYSETVLPGDEGCDLDGDGVIDNHFGAAMNDAARNANSDIISRGDLQSCRYVLTAVFTGPDPTMQSGFRWTFLLGTDAQSPPVLSDYFSGSKRFVILSDMLDALGRPEQIHDGTATLGIFQTSDARVSLPFPFCTSPDGRIPMDFYHVVMTGRLTSDANGPTRLDGVFCGARTAATWHRFANTSTAVPLPGATLLDTLVVGFNALGFRVDPTQPDMDLDGDGLEHFEDTDNDGNVDLCIDGNGTQIVGRDCPLDPRIADAYSEAEGFTTVGAQLAGRAP